MIDVSTAPLNEFVYVFQVDDPSALNLDFGLISHISL